MNVLDRLAELRQPVWGDGADPWEPLAGASIVAVDHTPRAIRFASYWLNRIDVAAQGWSLRHAFRRTQAAMLKAIRHVATEMTWFRNAPEMISPSGNENRVTLNVWGR